MKRALIIFAREPVAGRVKTRLAADLGADAAVALYAAMLDDVIGQAAAVPDAEPLLFWAVDSADAALPKRYPAIRAFRQQGANLGERMERALEQAFGMGADSCCIIGSDLPDLPAAYIGQGFRMLEQSGADVVFGPADDGGYYLVGMRRLVPGIFRDIPWSTDQVLARNRARAAELGLRVGLLPAWYDIDVVADLRRMTAIPGPSASRTRAVFAGLEPAPALQAEAA